MSLLRAFTLFFLFTAAAFAAEPAIISPANGTHIAPGAKFDFKYQIGAERGISSYNYHVWLVTDKPLHFSPELNWAGAFYLGTFANPNSPGNPKPKNPAPDQLTMPDFSQNPGGWGSGSFVSDATFYLAVFEEYSNGDPFVGHRISFVLNEIVYNATSDASESPVRSVEEL
ncbi:hypothetical protein VNI00_002614 [Paramarasmius palmivorus]|uniref:Uncharacterized protein n=1 Tax=Paramarasmius palmivorus TaxID=297713 RepID=A0AAW0DXS7_9AGAR